MFLDQLIRTFAAEDADSPADSIRISGPAGGDSLALSEMGVSATAHGKELLKLGYTVDQVVHDYGDLCQAITDLAFERNALLAVAEFRTLNRCLDNAIADAVTEFSYQRDTQIALQQSLDASERFGFLVHELRNSLGTATLAIHALELGNMTVGGATGAVLKRSLAAMGTLISRALAEVRSGVPEQRQTFSVASFIHEAETAAQLIATAAGCVFQVPSVDALLAIRGNRELLLAALANLLQNAFKFTHPHTDIALKAYELGEHILIEVEDHCGGLPPGSAEKMFAPFNQHSHDKSGLGLGLSIARQSVEADFGTLTVRDVPGTGCVFAICLPRHTLQ
jgi:signal transduction histidine kinase